LEDENRELERKIEESKMTNEEKNQMIKQLNEEEKNKMELESYMKKK